MKKKPELFLHQTLGVTSDVGDVVNAQTWEVSPQKNPVEPP